MEGNHLMVVGTLDLDMGKLSYRKELVDIDSSVVGIDLLDYKVLIEEVVMDNVKTNSYIMTNAGRYKMIFHGELTLPTQIEPRPLFTISNVLSQKYSQQSLDNLLLEEFK